MSSDLSAGQIVGAIGGAAIGFIVGGPAGAFQGAMIGMTVGGIIDPPPGPDIEGPRLKDLAVMVSTYGNAIPLVYGEENRISGNVIWSTGLIETVHEEEADGKGGGGGGTTTTYTYSVKFALALGAGEMVGIKRIWANSKLIFDIANADSIPVLDPVDGQIWPKGNGTHAVCGPITFYPGNSTQAPDPLIESYLGVGEVPAYRHIAYLVFDNLQLADFGNRLPNIEVEVQGIASPSIGGLLHDLCDRADIRDVSVAGLTDPVRGFNVTGSGALAGVISPLAATFHFDMAEQAGQVRFVKRGRSMKGTIPIDDMGAREVGTASGREPIDYHNVNPLELPKEVLVTYVDPGMDYQQNSQRAFKDIGNAANNVNLGIAVTITADEARRMADRLLWEYWSGKHDVKFKYSNKWARIQSGDVVGIPVLGNIIPYKVLRVTRGDNGIYDVECQRDDPLNYQSTADGASGNVPSNVVKFPGVTRLVLLDMPIIRDTDDNSGFYWVVTGESEGWRGADIRRSSDGGTTYFQMSPVAIRSTIGDLDTTLASGPTDYWDRGNTLDVTLTYSGDTLQSLEETTVLSGNNAAWIGAADGQDGEIIQFATATLIGPNQYRLSNLLRGRLGTEANVGTHGPGEVFVLINPSRIGRSDYGASDWDKLRHFKPVSILTEEADTVAQTFTCEGVGQTPYSPVHVLGTRDGSNNLTVTWVRRSRLRSPGLGAGPVPLGEETEAYEIDIYNGVNVVRTITATSPTASYTAAQQTADGLTPGNPVSLRIYQMSAVRGRGFPAIATV